MMRGSTSWFVHPTCDIWTRSIARLLLCSKNHTRPDSFPYVAAYRATTTRPPSPFSEPLQSVYSRVFVTMDGAVVLFIPRSNTMLLVNSALVKISYIANSCCERTTTMYHLK